MFLLFFSSNCNNVCLLCVTQNVDMDVVYEAGLEMTITVCTSMQLPGTSIKVPASAYVKIKKLSGRVSTPSILHLSKERKGRV